METTTPAAHGRLEYFPISFFSVVMGLAGLTIAYKKVEQVWHWQTLVSPVLCAFAAAVYLVIAFTYLTKLTRHSHHVVDEFRHPIRLSFFPTISIGLLLLVIAAEGLVPHVMLQSLWFLGSSVQLIFTLIVLSAWIHHEKFQIHHSNPAWFIPIVGNILVPVAGVPLGYMEISWFFFSIGILFWIVLLSILMNRFFFHNPVPTKLLPTLFILIAPPAVGFVAWMRLHKGVLDDPGRILYYAALFTTLLLFFQWKQFVKVKFALPWWAYSFPTAAITIASTIMLEKIGGVFFATLVTFLLVFLTSLVVLLIVKTIQAIAKGEICEPE
ncbi:tellurite resistance protein [Trichlorobacter thiogenes]|uniref:Tellurite resistance protein n=1 Tax=Trichlorobacter thiogenes TaxID=115783 RepID=A0A1T4L8N9_9BACT|nr:SLAC1 anion channel family protein [Trichlorobacter thiogenes]SJZ50950.1 tellurite resistance protein [Trichlorobacter thiogenes]